MGHVKEPTGIDFFVDPTPLTKEDKLKISELIAYYKQTGKKMPPPRTASRKSLPRKKKTASS
jgi:hypothetical protein